MRAGIALKKILIAGEAGQTTNYENALAAMQVHFVTSLQVKDVDEYDGLLLPGGGDVDPKLFGQLLIPETDPAVQQMGAAADPEGTGEADARA